MIAHYCKAYTAIDNAAKVKTSFARNIAMETLAEYQCNMEGLELPHGSSLRDMSLRRAMLKRVQFNEADLSNSDMRNAQLSHSTLENCTLQNAKLQSADLSYANLQNANLKNANLTGANLVNADLRDCDFGGAVLMNANFSGAVVDGASFVLANMKGARAVSEYQFCRVADTSNAVLPSGKIGHAPGQQVNLLSVLRAKRKFLSLLKSRRTGYLNAEAVQRHIAATDDDDVNPSDVVQALATTTAANSGLQESNNQHRHHRHHRHHKHRRHRHRHREADSISTGPRSRSQSPVLSPPSPAIEVAEL